MKQKIKTFLCNQRMKALKSKKGFSLLEVLIAVAIIGIISAIAIPQFADQRKNAAQVASDTSASNIAKAFQNCVVLNTFGSCDSLAKLKVTCPAGSICTSGGNSPTFCADLKRGTAGQDDFNVCVSVNANTGTINRTYGGALIGEAVCHTTATDSNPTSANCVSAVGTVNVTSTKCPNGNSDCSSLAVTPGSGVCGKTVSCKIPTTAGTCDNSGGTCS